LELCAKNRGKRYGSSPGKYFHKRDLQGMGKKGQLLCGNEEIKESLPVSSPGSVAKEFPKTGEVVDGQRGG